MNAIELLRIRFTEALNATLGSDTTPAQLDNLLAMIRPAQDGKFGDYQANCAMPLGKQLGKPPREIAAMLVTKASLEDLCSSVEIAGPGFINLTLSDQWLKNEISLALTDPRLGVAASHKPRTVVILSLIHI